MQGGSVSSQCTFSDGGHQQSPHGGRPGQVGIEMGNGQPRQPGQALEQQAGNCGDGSRDLRGLDLARRRCTMPLRGQQPCHWPAKLGCPCPAWQAPTIPTLTHVIKNGGVAVIKKVWRSKGEQLQMEQNITGLPAAPHTQTNKASKQGGALLAGSAQGNPRAGWKGQVPRVGQGAVPTAACPGGEAGGQGSVAPQARSSQLMPFAGAQAGR